ncbi:hypothetical protein RJ640_021760 [Escallonia rubra]|uniref:Uncharacterized protein n=1 Tax=Escallonia rubra TaxID=112253 RepID=A0AA88UEK3_9ASTE|nr:hypothetical protein RJ640_021760 [Escallonia rubra]
MDSNCRRLLLSISPHQQSQQLKEYDEVEELLRAAHDHVLLGLSVDSHTSRGGAARDSLIDPDLDRRFQALKSKPQPQPKAKAKPEPHPTSKPGPSPPPAVPEMDDLLVRFAALKGTPSSSSSNDEQVLSGDQNDDVDEVEKLMRWAMDAARLDPSTPSDDEVDDTDHTDDEDEDVGSEKKGKRK